MSPELSGNWAAPRSAAGLLQREANELKPCGAAEATMYSEAGAGTTGTEAVRGRTRRPTFPAVVCRRGRQGRGGLALAAITGARRRGGHCWSGVGGFGGIVVSLVTWPGHLPGYPKLKSSVGLGSRLALRSRTAEVFTTNNRPQDRRHNSWQDSAGPAFR
jgi:hypothetical protein